LSAQKIVYGIRSILDIDPELLPEIEARFWSKVDKTGSTLRFTYNGTPCWIWLGGTDGSGYGKFSITQDFNVIAHRAAYELLVGPIPSNHTLEHKCKNHPCIRPVDHLIPMTIRENILRGDGVAAQNARKTHCKKGHALTEDNLVPFALALGQRVCRICYNEQHAARKRRDKARSRSLN
jgi:hypothetical protein